MGRWFEKTAWLIRDLVGAVERVGRFAWACVREVLFLLQAAITLPVLVVGLTLLWLAARICPIENVRHDIYFALWTFSLDDDAKLPHRPHRDG